MDSGLRRNDEEIEMPTLTQINSFSPAEFSTAFGAVYEHSPWIAERAFALKPANGFTSRATVLAALVATVHSANEAEKLALLNSHPELAGKEAAAGTLGCTGVAVGSGQHRQDSVQPAVRSAAQ